MKDKLGKPLMDIQTRKGSGSGGERYHLYNSIAQTLNDSPWSEIWISLRQPLEERLGGFLIMKTKEAVNEKK